MFVYPMYPIGAIVVMLYTLFVGFYCKKKILPIIGLLLANGLAVFAMVLQNAADNLASVTEQYGSRIALMGLGFVVYPLILLILLPYFKKYLQSKISLILFVFVNSLVNILCHQSMLDLYFRILCAKTYSVATPLAFAILIGARMYYSNKSVVRIILVGIFSSIAAYLPVCLSFIPYFSWWPTELIIVMTLLWVGYIALFVCSWRIANICSRKQSKRLVSSKNVEEYK